MCLSWVLVGVRFRCYSPQKQQISAKFHISNLQNYKFQRHSPGGGTLYCVPRYVLCYWPQEPEAGVLFDEFTVNYVTSNLYCSESTDTLQPSSYSARVGVRSIVINPSVCASVCLSVCSSVCPWAYLWNRWTDRHEIVCADPLWPWLRPPPGSIALRYVLPVL